jgi:hypothetical protein
MVLRIIQFLQGMQILIGIVHPMVGKFFQLSQDFVGRQVIDRLGKVLVRHSSSGLSSSTSTGIAVKTPVGCIQPEQSSTATLFFQQKGRQTTSRRMTLGQRHARFGCIHGGGFLGGGDRYGHATLTLAPTLEGRMPINIGERLRMSRRGSSHGRFDHSWIQAFSTSRSGDSFALCLYVAHGGL